MEDSVIPLNSLVMFKDIRDDGREEVTVTGVLEGYMHVSGVFLHEDSGKFYQRNYFYYSVRETTEEGFSKMYTVYPDSDISLEVVS